MKKIANFISIVFMINIAFVVPISWEVLQADNPFVLFCDAQEKGEPDVQWFKEQMGISQKYAEETEGVYGMSWAHFSAMVLMVGFIAATFVVVYLRNKRTRQIITELLKEEEQNGS